MNKQELLTLIAQGESGLREFKTSFDNETIETIAAFSNATGGDIYLGISRKGDVIGVQADEETIKDWVNKIKQATTPQIFPQMNILNIDDKQVVQIHVQEYPIKPIAYKDRYLRRVGASNHVIPLNEIVDVQIFSLNSSFDSFPVYADQNRMDWSLVGKFLRKIDDMGRFKRTMDDKKDLMKLRLITEDAIPSFASVLLFGDPTTGIHIGRFKASHIIIDDILIKSPLLDAVDQAMTFIMKNISVAFEFTGELQRKEVWQYPLQALREILLNSIIHRDYRNPTDIIIKIFDDRIVFSNPGKLFGDLTIEDLKKDTYQANHRNKLLAESFYLLGEIEKYGTGFTRIRSYLEGQNIKMDFFENSGFFVVELSKDGLVERVPEKLGEKLGDKLGDKLGENQQNILNLIQDNAHITIPELSKVIKISTTAVENNLSKLKERGLLRRVGPDKGGYWEILT